MPTGLNTAGPHRQTVNTPASTAKFNSAVAPTRRTTTANPVMNFARRAVKINVSNDTTIAGTGRAGQQPIVSGISATAPVTGRRDGRLFR